MSLSQGQFTRISYFRPVLTLNPFGVTCSIMDIHTKLDRLITSSGMTAAEVGRRARITPDAISRWRAGTGGRKPSLFQALALARVLGVPLEYLADEAMDDPGGRGSHVILHGPLATLTAEQARFLLEIASTIGFDAARAHAPCPGRQGRRARGPHPFLRVASQQKTRSAIGPLTGNHSREWLPRHLPFARDRLRA